MGMLAHRHLIKMPETEKKVEVKPQFEATVVAEGEDVTNPIINEPKKAIKKKK